MSADELAAAVAEPGALPMPVPVVPEPQALPLKVVVELNDLRTRLAAVANPPREVFLALYEGAEPELFTTVEAARECCDDLAKTDAGERYWDWTVNEHGIHIQFWTHADDDRPLSETSGTVTPIVVQGDEPVSELERLTARVAELEAERHSTNESLSEAAEQLRVDRDRIAELEAAPVTVFRAEHPDSGITLGHYGTEAAARAHCETTERRSWGPGHTLVFDWIEDDEDRVAELVVTAGQNEESTTGYIVTALEIPSAYDPDADE